jgi:hypothetical protein
VTFLFFLARAQQVSCGENTVLTSTKKKVRRVLARKSLPRTNQNSHSAFSDQIRNNSKKDKTKTSQMMGWIENRPNKFLNQNFVRQGLPAKSKTRRFRLASLKYRSVRYIFYVTILKINLRFRTRIKLVPTHELRRRALFGLLHSCALAAFPYLW